MSSKPTRHNSKRTRHRIIEIELIPTTSTSNRKISAKVFVDGEVVCELPWVKSGQSLRWTKLIVYDGPDDSKVKLEVCEKHSIRDQRFRSDSYVISSVQQQTEVTVELVGFAWNATFKLLTQAAAERSFAAGLDKLRELKNAPSTLERLGRARPVFEAMLQLGSEVSEMHPTAKIVFVICTKAWEKLEAQEECDENVRELLDGLGGILDFVELVKKHARTERLQETIGNFLNLVEDVSIYTAERADLTKSAGRTLRGLLDWKEQNKIQTLLSRFEQLRAELDIGIGVETHKVVNTIDLHGHLSQLQPVNPSGYDPIRACQDGTREQIISDIMSWTERPEASKRLLWVHGQAGIGKSSVATSVCQQLANDRALAASYFCKRDDTELRDPLRLLNSVAHSLATCYSPYAKAVATAIEEDRELCTAHMDVRYKGLIKNPLQSLASTEAGRPLIVLIDALDECGTDVTRRRLLRHLSDMSKLVPWLRLIITSRPNSDIQEFFQNPDNAHVSYCDAHSFDASDDIRAYIEKELGDIARRHQWDEGSLDKLCEKAGGVFIWAATVRNYLTNFKGSTVPRLRNILYGQKSTVSDHLDMLYRSVILAGMKDVEEDQKALFRQCIGVIVSASTRQPLSIPSLSSLLLEQLDPISLEEVVGSLDAVLHLDGHDGAVRFYHPSFADYATDPSRSGDLYVSPAERNTELAAGCLKTMERELRFNMCELETSYLLNSQISDLAERVRSNVSDQLGYACTYWVSHLLDTPKGTLTNEVQEFMNSPRVLYWLEVLSLMGRVEAGLQGLLELQDWLLNSAEELLVCVEDMYRFISAFYDAISTSAPHIYVSALALAPSSVPVVRRFRHLFPNTLTLMSGGDADWPRWLRSLVHPDGVPALAVSLDGRLLVTGCSDGAVYIWDVKSGAMVGEPLFGDLGFVRCVALSSDSTRIVAGYLGRVLRIWDTQNGVAIGELIGHRDVVYCVAFSPDDKLIVSGSVDKTIRLWDSKTGAAVTDLLVEDPLEIESVAFSPDGKYIISSLLPGTVRVWSTATMTIVSELLVNAVAMTCATFSPDGTRIVFGSSVGFGTLRWDPRSAAMAGEPVIQNTPSPTAYAGFSQAPDGKRLVFPTDDNTIRIWDFEAGCTIGAPLTGHSDFVRSVAFMPDCRHIASCSNDKTVRLWSTRPTSGIAPTEPLIGHFDEVNCVAFSPDGNRVASGSRDKTVRLWDATTGAPVGEPLARHSDIVTCVAFSPNGKHLVSGSSDKTLQIWDARTGVAIGAPLTVHSDTVQSVAFSPSGTHIASGSKDGTLALHSVSFLDQPHSVSDSDNVVQIWRIQTKDATTKLSTDLFPGVPSLAFSPDGSLIACGSWDVIRLWDAKTGAAAGDPLGGGSPGIVSIAFSSDGSRIVSASSGKLQLWDTRLRIPVGEPLNADAGSVTSVAFSPDGNLIASGYYDRKVHLWNSKTGAAIGEPFFGHTGTVTSVSFSPDSSLVVSGSWDGSVRVWSVKAGTVAADSGSGDPSYSQHSTAPRNASSWPPHTYALPPHPEHRGWASLDGKSLLCWLPAHYRREYSPNMLYTISSEPSQSMIRLDFSKFAHGSSWASVACDAIRQNRV